MRFGAKWVLLVGILVWGMGSPVALAVEPPKRMLYEAGGRRDPFMPLVVDGKPVNQQGGQGFSGARPELFGILWDPGGKSIALINDLEAKVGDKVGEYQVAEIRRDAVVLRNGGEPLVLSISFGPAEGSSDLTGGEGR